MVIIRNPPAGRQKALRWLVVLALLDWRPSERFDRGCPGREGDDDSPLEEAQPALASATGKLI
jgi:hypothetical protein